MINITNLFFACSVFLTGCAATLTAPVKPLKKDEFVQSYYTFGIQLQKGLSDTTEIGLDISLLHLGGNLRYHVSRNAATLNSMQFGLGITGAKVNFMQTKKQTQAIISATDPI